MSRARVILEWMNGAGLSPGEVQHHFINSDSPDDVIVTQILRHGEGRFEFRKESDDFAAADASDGVLARISRFGDSITFW